MERCGDHTLSAGIRGNEYLRKFCWKLQPCCQVGRFKVANYLCTQVMYFFSGQGFLRGSLKRSSSLCWIREQQREYSTVINNLPPPFPSIVYRYPFLRAMMRRRSFIGLFWKDYENTFFFFFLCLTFSRTFLRRNSNPRIYRLHFPFQFLSLAL